MFGSVLPPNDSVAVPSELEKGTLQVKLSVVVKRFSANLRRCLKQIPRLSATGKG